MQARTTVGFGGGHTCTCFHGSSIAQESQSERLHHACMLFSCPGILPRQAGAQRIPFQLDSLLTAFSEQKDFPLEDVSCLVSMRAQLCEPPSSHCSSALRHAAVDGRVRGAIWLLPDRLARIYASPSDPHGGTAVARLSVDLPLVMLL